MAQQIDFKISSKHTGITLEDISVEQAAILTENIVGIKGVSRVIIVWTDKDGEDPEPDEPGEQGGRTIPHRTMPHPFDKKFADRFIMKHQYAPPPDQVVEPITPPPPDQVVEPITPPPIDPVVEPVEDPIVVPIDAPTTAPQPPIHKEIEGPPSKLLVTLDSKINIADSLTQTLVPLEENIHYIETEDGRLLIKYHGSRVDTTWENLNNLEQTLPIFIPRGVPLLDYHDKGNRRTAVLKFIQQMRKRSLTQGQSMEVLYKLDHPDDVAEDTNKVDDDMPGESVEIPIFTELDKISHQDLGKYVDINKNDMGYYDQGDGNIVIYNSGVKVHTSWKDLFTLSTYIDSESIETLSNLKQVAVRSFRKWMHDYPNQLPAGVDPDEEFRSAGVGQSVYPPLKPSGQDFGKGD